MAASWYTGDSVALSEVKAQATEHGRAASPPASPRIGASCNGLASQATLSSTICDIAFAEGHMGKLRNQAVAMATAGEPVMAAKDALISSLANIGTANSTFAALLAPVSSKVMQGGQAPDIPSDASGDTSEVDGGEAEDASPLMSAVPVAVATADVAPLGTAPLSSTVPEAVELPDDEHDDQCDSYADPIHVRALEWEVSSDTADWGGESLPFFALCAFDWSAPSGPVRSISVPPIDYFNLMDAFEEDFIMFEVEEVVDWGPPGLNVIEVAAVDWGPVGVPYFQWAPVVDWGAPGVPLWGAPGVPL